MVRKPQLALVPGRQADAHRRERPQPLFDR